MVGPRGRWKRTRSSRFIKGVRQASAFGGPFDHLSLDTGGRAPARLLRRHAAGLARDGGLYVPEVWRGCPGCHRRLLRPSLLGGCGRGDPPLRRREISESDLGRMANEPMPRSAIRRWCRSADRAGPLRARAVPRPHARLQGRGDAAAGAAMDHVLARRTAHHHRGGDLGRHRGAAVEAFAGLDNVDLVVLFPNAASPTCSGG